MSLLAFQESIQGEEAVTEEQLDMEYLIDHLRRADLVPFPWDGEDRNLGAFRSRDELVAWYGQPPGVENQPYRDRAFYTRELAHLSRTVQPNTIVEFGTSLGIGTCLLRWLNPTASLVTVDVNDHTFLPGDVRVEMGHLAKFQGIQCKYIRGESWKYELLPVVDLCFIDADHSYESVVSDSATAWRNRAVLHRWAIAWHDHNERHPGVMQAVAEFCNDRCVVLQSRPDSDTVWIRGER